MKFRTKSAIALTAVATVACLAGAGAALASPASTDTTPEPAAAPWAYTAPVALFRIADFPGGYGSGIGDGGWSGAYQNSQEGISRAVSCARTDAWQPRVVDALVHGAEQPAVSPYPEDLEFLGEVTDKTDARTEAFGHAINVNDFDAPYEIPAMLPSAVIGVVLQPKGGHLEASLADVCTSLKLDPTKSWIFGADPDTGTLDLTTGTVNLGGSVAETPESKRHASSLAFSTPAPVTVRLAGDTLIVTPRGDDGPIYIDGLVISMMDEDGVQHRVDVCATTNDPDDTTVVGDTCGVAPSRADR